MNLRSFRLRTIGPPLAVAALSATALVWFDRIWIPTQQQYINERNLRALRTISAQIKTKVDNFDQALDHAIDSFPVAQQGDDLLQKYVKLFSPELEIVTVNPTPSARTRVAVGDPPNVRIQRDEGHTYLYLGYRHEKEHREGRQTVTLIARGDLDKVTASSLARTDFDAMLLLDARGTTIARQSSSGLELTSFDKVSESGQNGTAGRPGVFERIRATSGLAVVTVGAADYMLYTQPVQLSLVNDATQAPEEWTLCGMVRLDRFRAASSTIPTTYWLCFGTILAFICFAIPLLKLQVLSPCERLTRFDSVSISAGMFMLMALAAFAAHDLHAFGVVVPAAVDEQLRSVSDAMNEHVQGEAAAVHRQIAAFSRPDMWRQKLGYSSLGDQPLTEIRQHLNASPGADIKLSRGASGQSQCTPPWSCRAGVLAHLDKIEYPFFKMVVWSDADGWQRIKWSTSPVITPFVNVAEAKLPYFDSLKMARRLWLTDAHVPHDGVAVITSPNTGDKLTVFWRALEPLSNPASKELPATAPPSAHIDLTGVTLLTTPVSLTNPVLPKNVQFAVVDRTGRVLFHSDLSRALAENMFQECEDSPALKSLVASRETGAISVRYLGRAHRLFVTPLNVGPFNDPRWSLVTFQAAAVGETANLQTVNLAASMFIVYALAIASCAWVVGAYGPAAFRTLWWPNAAKGASYRRAAAVGMAAAAACIAAPAFAPAATLVPVTATLIVCALTMMFAIVHTDRSTAPSRTWPLDFFCARASLLFLLAAVPATLCFHVAFAFQSDLVAKRADSFVVSELNARARRINQQAQTVAVCAETDPGSQACSKIGLFLDRRGSGTVWDVDIPARPAATGAAVDGPALAPNALTSFLKLAYRPYNEIAADLLLASGRPRSGAQVSRVATPPPSREDGWLIAIVLLVVAYGLVRYLLRPIYALDLTPPPFLLAATGLSDDTSLLVLGPPGARRTERLLRHPRVRVFDVRSLSFSDEGVAFTAADLHAGVAADCGLGDRPVQDWREAIYLAASIPLTIVAIDHLEHRLDNAEFRTAMLECLETLVYRQKATVWCSTVRDPIELLEEVDTPAPDQRRWARVFERFRREHLGLEIDGARSNALALALRDHPGLAPDVRALIVAECELAPDLLAIGENLIDRLPANSSLSREDALTEIGRSARPLYGEMWRACSAAERLTLVQLAEEGLVNPNNGAAIARLLSAGLVRRGPSFRVMNETFRRFAAGAESHTVIAAWEREGVRVPWGTIATTGVTVAFGLAGLLLLTQEQLVDAWISYVPALAPAIPTMWKVLASAQKGRLEVPA